MRPALKSFAEDTTDYRKEIQRVQRKLSRSLRLNNPDNFEENSFKMNANGNRIHTLGKVKKGAKKWHFSNQYNHLKNKISELQRKMSTSRKCSHGRLVNYILGQGHIVKTEGLSYKSWQIVALLLSGIYILLS